MTIKTPVRIFDGTDQPHEPFWKLRNAAEGASGEPEIEFYGYISQYSWFEDDITPKKFKDDLNKLGGGGPVTLRINSGGGDVFAASVIRSTLVEYPGMVTVRIDGLCASAATFVATAGNVVRMQDTAFFMIHDPSAFAWGGIEDLKQVLDLLKTVKDGIMDAYQARTSLSREKLAKMMTDETWFTAKEAKDAGFIDEVIGENVKPKAGVMEKAAILNALTQFVNVPAALRAQASEPVVDQQASERLRAEAQRILVLRGEVR